VRLSGEVAGSDATLGKEALDAIQDADMKAEAQKVAQPVPTGHVPTK
jgi:hypothetical protein